MLTPKKQSESESESDDGIIFLSSLSFLELELTLIPELNFRARVSSGARAMWDLLSFLTLLSGTGTHSDIGTHSDSGTNSDTGSI